MLLEAYDFLSTRISERPQVALILGSGLGDFADELRVDTVINSADIPGYPVSSVQGHEGRLFFGRVTDGDRSSPPCLVFKGRVHTYETADVDPAVLSVRLSRLLGASILLATNAAGGINPQFRPGDLMVIRDFINLSFRSPTLTGKTQSLSGPALEITDHILAAARRLGVPTQNGVYAWTHGPSYETAAEIGMFRRIGADAVGMSTVPEFLVAQSLGMRAGGISLISNLGTGVAPSPLSHSEVTQTAKRTARVFTQLMREILLSLVQLRAGT